MNLARHVTAWLACVAVLAIGAEITISEEDASEEPQELDVLDEVVTESELDSQQKAESRRRQDNSDVDFVTVTRSNTRTGSAIRLRVEPFSPQRGIRFRASDARRLAEGENSRLKLQRDRLTTSGSLIRSATLEFNAGTDEADGMPAVVRINARTSLFNFDYARLLDSTQPLIATFRNALDPETLRCAGELRLGIGAEDFHDRFVLLGNGIGDCNSTIKSRVGDLIFGDTVPQRLRQELQELYDTMYNQLARTPGNEPGIVFVVWRPESPSNDFRFVRSLNRTDLLFFNGPSWEHGFSGQQRDSIREEISHDGQ